MPPQFEKLQLYSEKVAAMQLMLQHLSATERLAHATHWAETLRDAHTQATLLFFQARVATQVTAICLVQLQTGNVALLWPPCVLAEKQEADTLALLNFVFRELQKSGVHIVQSLLASQAEASAELLYQAGCQKIADLAYMMLEAPHFPLHPPAMDAVMEVIDPHDKRLRELLEKTYEGSLDCPLLDGWRSIDDVIDSYWATGTPRPKLWRIAHTSSGDAGCVIAAEYPQEQQWELIYLGVSPCYRGEGWGSRLLHWLLFTAQEEMIERVILAVDVVNHPAVSIYKNAGFVEIDRRLAIAKRL